MSARVKKSLSCHRTPGPAPDLTLAALLNAALLAVLLAFAWLREEPMFWRNAGGWPVWLREFVGISFYPLLGLELLLLMTFSALVARRAGSRCPQAGAAVVLLPLLWGLLFLVIVVLLANNLDNWLTGQPLHWHPD